MPFRLRRLLVPLSLTVAAVSVHAQTPATLTSARLEGVIRPLVARSDFAGAVTVTQNGRVLFSSAWGKADAAAARPFTPATRFHLGPLSQQFTAVLVLDLAADHYLTLDDSLSRWLPGIRWAGQVTLRELLGHRAGLPRDFPTYPDGSERYPTDGDRYAWLSTVPRASGGAYTFSNVGYWLLAQVAARAGEAPFAALLRERLFEPNGLRTLDIDDGAHPIPDLATEYEASGLSTLTPARPRPLGGRLGASGMVGTIADLATWTSALQGGRILPRPLLEAMVEGRWGALDDTTRAGRRAIGSGGSGPGYVAATDWYPAERLTVVVLANTRTGAAEQLRDAAPAAIFGLPIPPIALPAVGPAPQPSWLPDYVGTYAVPTGARIAVVQVGTSLQLAAGDDALTDIYPLGSEAFFQRATYARIEFVRDAGGKVKQLRWTRNGTTLEFTRE
jgi:CubicO group peptidase (beta-lactamase class C family)